MKHEFIVTSRTEKGSYITWRCQRCSGISFSTGDEPELVFFEIDSIPFAFKDCDEALTSRVMSE